MNAQVGLTSPEKLELMFVILICIKHFVFRMAVAGQGWDQLGAKH